jgi:hypothetical protein
MHDQEPRADCQGSYKNAQGGSPQGVRVLLVGRPRSMISPSKSPEIRFWKNPEKGLEKDSSARQNRPIGWGFHEIRKWLNVSIG